ncbi:hypothetical protein RRG08_040849 [Elysia crispata]|uniref:Uncharacterized protein n=1 Tax=Elysia crispata TaxID=231223 RepID=A0AAE1A857_9GAST|nr:hypothetical protein RRG08_040849 [Elysia crispata]
MWILINTPMMCSRDVGGADVDVDSNQYPNDVFKRCPCSPVSGTVGLILRVGWGQHVDSYPKTHAHMLVTLRTAEPRGNFSAALGLELNYRPPAVKSHSLVHRDVMCTRNSKL